MDSNILYAIVQRGAILTTVLIILALGMVAYFNYTEKKEKTSHKV